MTMPSERTRTLRWGFEVLQEISDAAMVTDREKARAAELLDTYPTPLAVSSWIDEDVPCLPVEAAVAIEATGDLLRDILRSEAFPADLRRSVMFTLRHFPEPGDAERWSRPCRDETIRAWLMPEDSCGPGR